MTKREKWKRDVRLVEIAIKKMGLILDWNDETYDVFLLSGPPNWHNVDVYDIDDKAFICDLDNPKSLGSVAYFYINDSGKSISNIFFGVKNYEELKIKLDLMA